jgi:hypothetical protein
MTEKEWVESSDPAKMMEHLTHERVRAAGQFGATVPRKKSLISDRKLRLFLCGCCRLIWETFTEDLCRRAVEVAERFIEGQATENELVVALESVSGEVFCSPGGVKAHWVAPVPGRYTTLKQCLDQITAAPKEEAAQQASLLREIIGNPFRPVVLPGVTSTHKVKVIASPATSSRDQITAFSITCPWLTSDVKAITQKAYDVRNPDGTLDGVTLMVLAHALEESGCSNVELLCHCRGNCVRCQGVGTYRDVEPDLDTDDEVTHTCESCRGAGRAKAMHVRGCWALDLLLNKE